MQAIKKTNKLLSFRSVNNVVNIKKSFIPLIIKKFHQHFHTSIQTLSLETATTTSSTTNNSKNTNNDLNSPNRVNESPKSKKRGILKFFLFLLGALFSLPIILFNYLKYAEKVDSLKYDPKDFILKLNNNFFVYKHYFQMRRPPAASSSNMAVIKYGVDDKNILLYNVVALTDVVKELLAKVGDENLKTIVIPNKEHYLFAHEYIKYYILDKKNSNIKIYCPPQSKKTLIKHFNNKLNENLTDLLEKIMIEFPVDHKLPKEWTEDKDLNERFEAQTFESIELLNEIVLFDSPNKMLVACDMCHNVEQLTDATIPGTKALEVYGKFIGIVGKFGVSPMFRYIVTDKSRLAKEVENVNNWDWKGITMAHGKPLLPTEERNLKKEWKDNVEMNLLK
ncbi:hypothetical protein ABK040_007777 [Willaertia magna]